MTNLRSQPSPTGSALRRAAVNTPSYPADFPKLSTVVFMGCLLLTLGCGNDGGASGTNGTGANGGAGATNGMGATGGDSVTPFRGAVLCSAVFAPDRTGFIRLVSEAEIDAGGEIDAFEGAIEIAGGVSCATRDNAVFAASFESPTITRYDVVDGELVPGETVSFMNFGVTSLAGLSDDIQIFSDTKAYFFDPVFSQIIVWNPTAMETIEALPLTGFEPPEGLTRPRLRAARIDDRLVLWGGLQDAEGVAVRGAAFAFVDPETDAIVTDSIDACGAFISTAVTTSNGDTYFGTAGIAAVEHALGLQGSFEPCALRVRAGANEIDRTFLADLNVLTTVGPTAGPFALAGSGTKGLVLAYDQTAVPIDSMISALEHTLIPNWRFYEIELGSTEPAVLVEELPVTLGFSGSFLFDGGSFLTQATPDFSATNLLDLSQRPFEVAFTIRGGAIALFARMGSESGTRMAQVHGLHGNGRAQRGHRGGSSLLPF